MKHIVQVPVDLLVGLAIYYLLTMVFKMGGHWPIILALVGTAIFAEIFEIGIKRTVPRD